MLASKIQKILVDCRNSRRSMLVTLTIRKHFGFTPATAAVKTTQLRQTVVVSSSMASSKIQAQFPIKNHTCKMSSKTDVQKDVLEVLSVAALLMK